MSTDHVFRKIMEEGCKLTVGQLIERMVAEIQSGKVWIGWDLFVKEFVCCLLYVERQSTAKHLEQTAEVFKDNPHVRCILRAEAESVRERRGVDGD